MLSEWHDCVAAHLREQRLHGMLLRHMARSSVFETLCRQVKLPVFSVCSSAQCNFLAINYIPFDHACQCYDVVQWTKHHDDVLL